MAGEGNGPETENGIERGNTRIKGEDQCKNVVFLTRRFSSVVLSAIDI